MKITVKQVEKLLMQHGLTACFECGKCTAVCPMSEMFPHVDYGHTPRGIVEKALLDSDLVTGDAIWYCLTCDVCTKGCPCNVKFRDFIEDLRKMVMEAGHEEYGIRCSSCSRYFLPDPALKLITEKISKGNEAPAFLLTCPKCRTRLFSKKMMSSLTPPYRWSR